MGGIPAADAPAPEALAWWALRFTPHVAWVDEALLLEVSGTLRLWGGRRALLQRIHESNPLPVPASQAQAATSLIALARLRTPGAARAEDMPLHALSAARPHLPLLAQLGCRTWGEAMALPRAGLARRCGPALGQALDRAFGRAPDAYPWATLPERFVQPLELPTRVDDAPALLWAANRLLTNLQLWLQARQLSVLAIELRWRLDVRRLNGRELPPTQSLVLRTAQPVQRMAHLRRLLAERLARTAMLAPAVALRLRALHTAPWRAESHSLLPDEQRQGEALHVFIERVGARLGAGQVLAAEPRADHRPECRQVWRPADAVLAEATVRKVAPESPPGRPKAASTPLGGSAACEAAERGGPESPPGRPKAASAPLGGSGPREAGERGGTFLPPGRPKAASTPLGGSGPREAGERGGTFLPPGRPKAASAPLGGSAACEAGERGGLFPWPDALAPTWLLPEPQPLAVRDGRPCHRGAALRLLTSPRRVEAGWWSEAVSRDYFIAQGVAAELLWVFRERPTVRLPDATPRWFLHGLYG
ncbi:MAG: hypothetical protein QM772_03250 [Ottowia sp.]|uniref:hypothetical protein n=1 Tax=Ottowia sp. TaxID=1898956 RepID=UPI0039E6A209